jgi:hypothetical protein
LNFLGSGHATVLTQPWIRISWAGAARRRLSGCLVVWMKLATYILGLGQAGEPGHPSHFRGVANHLLITAACAVPGNV